MTPDENIPTPPIVTAAPARAYPPAAYAVEPELPRYANRVMILGVCFAIFCVFYLASAIFFNAALSTASLADSMHNAPPGSRAASETPPQQAGILALFVAVANAVRIIGIVCSAIAAIGLLAKQKWGRGAPIIVSIPMLILFPFGTILAAFAIYFMVKRGSRENWQMLTAKP